eukprot:2544916-Prymnesium_polylepis.1
MWWLVRRQTRRHNTAARAVQLAARSLRCADRPAADLRVLLRAQALSSSSTRPHRSQRASVGRIGARACRAVRRPAHAPRRPPAVPCGTRVHVICSLPPPQCCPKREGQPRAADPRHVEKET